MKNGRQAVVAGVMMGLAFWPVGAHAAEHGGAAMKEHGGTTVTTESSKQPAQSTSTSTSATTSAGADASVSGGTNIGVTAGETSMPATPGSASSVGASGSAAAQESSATQAAVAAETASSTQAKVEPTPEQLRQAIRDHIAQIKEEEGAFTIEDEQTGKVRTLELAQAHERVGKTGSAYYSCTDMKDTESGEMLDLDFDVEQVGDQLLVTDTRIHKVNGNARYTYDANDNRVPAASTSTNTSTSTN